MNRHKHNFAACLIVGCTTFVPLAARAQELGAADVLYGNGVQAYFRGCSAEAESAFSSLMGVDPNDPRAFYFRALSRIRQGREVEARTDMQVGAQLEARMPNRFDIGKTLERVQGPARLMLERYRSQAHQTAALSPPIGAVRAPDAPMLRERRVVPLDAFSLPGVPEAIAAPLPSQETVNPPAPKATQPAQDFNAAPAMPDDPFNDDAAASPPPKAQPPAPPAKAAAPETPPEKAPLPPAPRPEAPEAPEENSENPFL